MFSKTRRMFSASLAAVMALSMSAAAFADTMDPNFTNYNTPYTTAVAKNGTATLMAVPADAYFQPTTFTSVDDAGPQADDADTKWVNWEAVAGDIDNVSNITWADHQDGDVIVSRAQVKMTRNANVGPTSICATNKATDATMNFTVLVDGTISNAADNGSNTATGVKYRFYQQTAENSRTSLMDEATITVAGAVDDSADYPTPIDGVTDSELSAVTDEEIASGAVTSLTLAGHGTLTNYTDANYNYYGWQYRVYDASGNLMSDSEWFGAGEVLLENNCTVVWQFGQYGVVNFPADLDDLTELPVQPAQ